jgi:hypothetical protein
MTAKGSCFYDCHFVVLFVEPLVDSTASAEIIIGKKK